MAGFGQQGGLATVRRDDWNATGYGGGKGAGASHMEGGHLSKYDNYEGTVDLRPVSDYIKAGMTGYVSVATDPKYSGQFFNIPELKVTIDGQTYTLQNVPAYSHDTGKAIRGNDVDVHVDWDATKQEMNSATKPNLTMEQLSPAEFAARVKGADDLVREIVSGQQAYPTQNSMDVMGVGEDLRVSQSAWNQPGNVFGPGSVVGASGAVTPGASIPMGLSAVDGGPAGLSSSNLAVDPKGIFGDFAPTGFGSPSLKGVNNFAAMPQQQALSTRAEALQSAIANALPQDVQDKLGISSGYRGFEVQTKSGQTKTYNETIGGAQHSAHLGGDAIDIVGPRDAQAQAIAAARENAINKGLGMGVGSYKDGSIHIDYGPNRKGLETWGEQYFTPTMKAALSAPVEQLKTFYDPLAKQAPSVVDLQAQPALPPVPSMPTPFSAPAAAMPPPAELDMPTPPVDPLAGQPMPASFGVPPELQVPGAPVPMGEDSPPAPQQTMQGDIAPIGDPTTPPPADFGQPALATAATAPLDNALPPLGYDPVSGYNPLANATQLAPMAGQLPMGELSPPAAQTFFGQPSAPPPTPTVTPGLPETPYAPAAPSGNLSQSPTAGMMAGGGYPMPTARPETQALASAASVPESFGRQNMPVDVAGMQAELARQQYASDLSKQGMMPAAIGMGVLGTGLSAYNAMQNAPGNLGAGAISLGRMIAEGFGNIPSIPGAEIAAQGPSWPIDIGAAARSAVGITPEAIHATIAENIPPGTGAMVNRAINSGVQQAQNWFGGQISSASQALANGLGQLPSKDLTQAAQTADELIGVSQPAPASAPVSMAQHPDAILNNMQSPSFGAPPKEVDPLAGTPAPGESLSGVPVEFQGPYKSTISDDEMPGPRPEDVGPAPAVAGAGVTDKELEEYAATPKPAEAPVVGRPATLEEQLKSGSVTGNPGVTTVDAPKVVDQPTVAPAAAPAKPPTTFGQPGAAPKTLRTVGDDAPPADLPTAAPAPTGAWNAPWQKTTLPQDTPGALMSLGPMTPMGYEFAPEIAAMAATAGLLGGGQYFNNFTPSLPSIPSAISSVFSGGFGGFGQQQNPNTQYSANSAMTDFFSGFGGFGWGGGGGDFGPGGNPGNSVGVNEPGFGNQGRLDPNDPGMTGTGYY